jgi:hypothetical protein
VTRATPVSTPRVSTPRAENENATVPDSSPAPVAPSASAPADATQAAISEVVAAFIKSADMAERQAFASGDVTPLYGFYRGAFLQKRQSDIASLTQQGLTCRKTWYGSRFTVSGHPPRA